MSDIKNRINEAVKDAMRAKDKENPNSFKVRRAKVGGYRDYFEDHEMTAIDRMVEAAVRGDRTAARQALLLDPVVNSISQAEAILAEMLEVHKDFLPQFK